MLLNRKGNEVLKIVLSTIFKRFNVMNINFSAWPRIALLCPPIFKLVFEVLSKLSSLTRGSIVDRHIFGGKIANQRNSILPEAV